MNNKLLNHISYGVLILIVLVTGAGCPKNNYHPLIKLNLKKSGNRLEEVGNLSFDETQTQTYSAICEEFYRFSDEVGVVTGYEKPYLDKCPLAGFELTEQSLEELRNEGLSEDILKNLHPLLEQGVMQRRAFWSSVESLLEHKDFDDYKKNIIFKHTLRKVAEPITSKPSEEHLEESENILDKTQDFWEEKFTIITEQNLAKIERKLYIAKMLDQAKTINYNPSEEIKRLCDTYNEIVFDLEKSAGLIFQRNFSDACPSWRGGSGIILPTPKEEKLYNALYRSEQSLLATNIFVDDLVNSMMYYLSECFAIIWENKFHLEKFYPIAHNHFLEAEKRYPLDKNPPKLDSIMKFRKECVEFISAKMTLAPIPCQFPETISDIDAAKAIMKSYPIAQELAKEGFIPPPRIGKFVISQIKTIFKSGDLEEKTYEVTFKDGGDSISDLPESESIALENFAKECIEKLANKFDPNQPITITITVIGYSDSVGFHPDINLTRYLQNSLEIQELRKLLQAEPSPELIRSILSSKTPIERRRFVNKGLSLSRAKNINEYLKEYLTNASTEIGRMNIRILNPVIEGKGEILPPSVDTLLPPGRSDERRRICDINVSFQGKFIE